MEILRWKQVWLCLFKEVISPIMIYQLEILKSNLKFTMTRLKKENENVLLKWKGDANLINQNNKLVCMKTKLFLLPTEHKRNYAYGNSKLQWNKSKSDYINSFSDPSSLDQLWLSEVIINNLCNWYLICRK